MLSMRHSRIISIGCERGTRLTTSGSFPLLAAGGRKNSQELEVRQATREGERRVGKEGQDTTDQDPTKIRPSPACLPVGGRGAEVAGNTMLPAEGKNNTPLHVSPKGATEHDTLLP